MRAATTLVLGIGNTLLSDEGVGIHVLEAAQQMAGERTDIEFLDGGTLSFTLADAIARHPQLVVVDAARVDGPPGTIAVFEGEAMDARLRGGLQSVHEVGLSDLMDISRLTDSLPKNRALVGVCPEAIDWGEGPTPAVARAVRPAAEKVLEIIQRWQG